MHKQNEINILIVEDQRIIVEGLTLILSKVEGFGKISSCLHIYSLLETIEIEKPDVILLDFNMPMVDGIQCLKTILSKYPNQKIIMLTGYDDTDLIREALNLGAKGYVLKNIAKQELVTAIQTVYNGQNYLDENVQKKVLDAFLTNADNHKEKLTNREINLSNREREVLKLIAEGQSSSKIANSLFISVNTVDTHRKNIMAKCGVKKITELITFANKNNLI
ncbi:MAG: response regulator [Sphingobacterium composti]|uniref:response regulator n=1 Tax=Sphingobacterium composti TaxID=363260 RepID=UPI001357ECC1|nr:response regulator transcription factor [Sphingobacterium composti Ten et al. 2007 non Yoo et al. 2007]